MTLNWWRSSLIKSAPLEYQPIRGWLQTINLKPHLNVPGVKKSVRPNQILVSHSRSSCDSNHFCFSIPIILITYLKNLKIRTVYFPRAWGDRPLSDSIARRYLWDQGSMGPVSRLFPSSFSVSLLMLTRFPCFPLSLPASPWELPSQKSYPSCQSLLIPSFVK